MARHLRSLAALVGAASMVAGCSVDPSLDAPSIADGIPAAVVPESPDIVTDVVCPDPVPEVVAQSMTCTAELAGDALTVDLEIDENGVASSVVREPLLDLGRVADDVAQRLASDLGIDVEVECPGVVVVAAVGRRVDCTGLADGVERGLVVEVVDDDGSWSVDFTR